MVLNSRTPSLSFNALTKKPKIIIYLSYYLLKNTVLTFVIIDTTFIFLWGSGGIKSEQKHHDMFKNLLVTLKLGL